MVSYGFVETLGLVAAIEVADTALKAADVILIDCCYVKGGIVTVEIAGDIAAVTAAVDAAVESAKRTGNFLSSNIIARVYKETEKIIGKEIVQNIKEKEIIELKKDETAEQKVNIIKKAESQEKIEVKMKKFNEDEKLEKEDTEIKKLKKQYQDMKVVDLKMKVNSLKLGYTWNQIKTMTKKKLIEILIKNN